MIHIIYGLLIGNAIGLLIAYLAFSLTLIYVLKDVIKILIDVFSFRFWLRLLIVIFLIDLIGFLLQILF